MRTVGCIRLIIGLVVVAVFGGVFLAKALATADEDGNLWFGAGLPSVQQVAPSTTTSESPTTQYGNCEQQDYVLAGTGSAANTCLTHTAFGYMAAGGAIIPPDSNKATAVRETSSLIYGLAPVPQQGMVTALTSSIHGAYLHFYRNILDGAELKTDSASGQLYYAVSRFPDITPTDQAGDLLEIQDAPAFSSNGAWMLFDDPGKGYVRLNLATFNALPFGPTFASTNGTRPPTPSAAVSNDGRYAVLAGAGSSYFQIYDLASCNTVPAVISKPVACQTKDFSSQIASMIPNIASIFGVHFVSDTTIDFSVLYKGSSAGDYRVADFRLYAPGQAQNGIDYLALGDSFGSGQGAYNYKPGTDTADNTCHLSTNSYPFLMSTGRFTDYNSVACSGATTNDIINSNGDYAGQTTRHVARTDRTNVEQALENFDPGYIDQLDFVERYQPEVVTISVGGNDVGFSTMLSECVTWPSPCYEHYEDRLAKLKEVNSKFNDVVSTYTKLRNAMPDGRIYVIGYPHIAEANGACAMNVRLSSSELVFAEQFIDYLNSMLKSAAEKVGVSYVDTTHALDGHRLCETKSSEVAVNGLTAGNDKLDILGRNIIGNESYHPNALGHQLLAHAILSETHNLTMTMPMPNLTAQPPTITDEMPILQLPRSGDAVADIYKNDDTMTSNMVVRGNSMSIALNGQQAGSSANTNYAATLHSQPVSLGAFKSDDSGNLNGIVTIPNDTPPGYHTLHISGTNLAHQTIDLYKVFYVAAIDSDYDGDGIPNSRDSCPLIQNSGIDADHDGIDDVCDGDVEPTTPSVIDQMVPKSMPASLSQTVTNQKASTHTGSNAPVVVSGDVVLHKKILIAGVVPMTRSGKEHDRHLNLIVMGCLALLIGLLAFMAWR